MVFPPRTIISLLMFGLLSTASVASESNIEPLTEAEALAVDAKYYAETYGVSEDEAIRRLLIMTQSQEALDKLKNVYGSKISGIYFDSNSRDFGIEVNLATDKIPSDQLVTIKSEVKNYEEKIKGKLNGWGVPQNLIDKAEDKSSAINDKLKKLGVSEALVAKAKDKMNQSIEAKIKFKGNSQYTKETRLSKIEEHRQELFSKIPNLEMIADNEKTGAIILYVKNDNGTVKKLANEIIDLPVEVEVIPSGIVLTHTRGGSKILNSNDNLHCMTGFVAKDSSGTEGVLTAGHCLKGFSNLSYTDKDGSKYPLIIKNYIFDNRADIGFVTANHATSAGQFYADNSSTPRTLTGTMSRVNTRVSNGTVTGSYICHLGQTSKTDSTLIQSCGEVTSTNGQGSDGVGGSTYVVVSNTKKGGGTKYNPATDGVGTMRCISGDSGGPWFARTIGYGIQSGCSWVDKATQKQALTVVYTSLDYANLVGATVVTK